MSKLVSVSRWMGCCTGCMGPCPGCPQWAEWATHQPGGSSPSEALCSSTTKCMTLAQWASSCRGPCRWAHKVQHGAEQLIGITCSSVIHGAAMNDFASKAKPCALPGTIPLHGGLQVDAVVAHGCRALGKTQTVTGVGRDGHILTLNDQPALQQVAAPVLPACRACAGSFTGVDHPKTSCRKRCVCLQACISTLNARSISKLCNLHAYQRHFT